MQRIVHEEPRSICEQVPLIPDWLEMFIFKLMSKKAIDRFSDATSVAVTLETEIAFAENPSQNKKPLRLEYCVRRRVRPARWKASVAVISSVVAVVCLAVLLARPFTQTKETDAPSPSGDVQKISEWLNEDMVTGGAEAIHRRAISLEQSYQGSDPLPVAAPFEDDLRSLKKSLHLFENQVP